MINNHWYFICHTCFSFLTYVKNEAYWMKHKLVSRLLGEISITSDDTTLMAESNEELESLDESEKRRVKKLT